MGEPDVGTLKVSWVRVLRAAEALYAVRGLGRRPGDEALIQCLYEVQTVLMAAGVDWSPPELVHPDASASDAR